MKTFAVSFLCSPSKMRKRTGESPIEVSISVNGDRVYSQLQKSCDPRVFKKCQSSKQPNDIKIYCETVRHRINEIQTAMEVQGIPVTARRIKDALEGRVAKKSLTLKSLSQEFLETKISSPAVWYKYKNTFKRLMDMVGADKLADEVTPQDILNFCSKYEKKFTASTMKTEMKKLKALFNFAFNSGYLQKHPFSGLRFAFKEPQQVFLTYDEIKAIRDAKLSERLDKVRNFFLFLCFSGLEYADIVELKKEDVKENRFGQLYIKKQRVKTKEEYISILYEDAEELWKLFDGDIPIISNQKTNAALKEIATAAGIDKTITTLTARHTYATYLLSTRCMPIEIVQKMLGHTTPSQSLHYARLLDESVFLANHQRRGAVQSPDPTRKDMEDIEAFEKLLGI